MYSLSTLINKITAESKKQGLSVNQMLINSSSGKSLVDNMKKGRNPSIDKIYSVADYLNCSVDYLLGRTEEPSLSGADEISGNAAEIAELFSSLTETQQGELIGRAKMMIEQNQAKYRQEDAG